MAKDSLAGIVLGDITVEVDPQLMVDTLDDFWQTWPELRDEVEPHLTSEELSLSTHFTTEETEPAWYRMDDGARQLVVAAVAVARILRMPPEELPAALVALIGNEE